MVDVRSRGKVFGHSGQAGNRFQFRIRSGVGLGSLHLRLGEAGSGFCGEGYGGEEEQGWGEGSGAGDVQLITKQSVGVMHCE